jgi:hypothetical protein
MVEAVEFAVPRFFIYPFLPFTSFEIGQTQSFILSEITRRHLHILKLRQVLYNFASRNGSTTNPRRGKCTLASMRAGVSSSRGLITTSSGDRSTSHPIVGLLLCLSVRSPDYKGVCCRLTHLVLYHPVQHSPSCLAPVLSSYRGRNAVWLALATVVISTSLACILLAAASQLQCPRL